MPWLICLANSKHAHQRPRCTPCGVAHPKLVMPFQLHRRQRRAVWCIARHASRRRRRRAAACSATETSSSSGRLSGQSAGAFPLFHVTMVRKAGSEYIDQPGGGDGRSYVETEKSPTRHGVDGAVDGVGARHRACQLRGDARARRVVRVHVDGHVGVLFPGGGSQEKASRGAAGAGCD